MRISEIAMGCVAWFIGLLGAIFWVIVYVGIMATFFFIGWNVIKTFFGWFV